ncbi:MAG: carbonic anhydrase [Oscillospiraceae bacterium]|nr:carbonic anhydrase [Oscillospiraceae bacterium]
MDRQKDAKQALERLKRGNEQYLTQEKNSASLRADCRETLAREGQKPYAVIVACSDSRVPPEHIFSAGLGELFVIRTAGHLIDWNALGSVEYGVKSLGAPLVVILGHTKCGAVSAALSGKAKGAVSMIAERIAQGLHGETNPYLCEVQHTKNSLHKLKSMQSIAPLLATGEVVAVGAMYDIETGIVTFLEETEE